MDNALTQNDNSLCLLNTGGDNLLSGVCVTDSKAEKVFEILHVFFQNVYVLFSTVFDKRLMSSERRGGGAGDFVAGFLLGGVLFGTLGYLIAPVVSFLVLAGRVQKGHGRVLIETAGGLRTPSPSNFTVDC